MARTRFLLVPVLGTTTTTNIGALYARNIEYSLVVVVVPLAVSLET